MQGAWSKESGTAAFSPFTYLACDCIDCKLYATNTQLDFGEMSSTTEKLGTNQEQFMKSSHRNYNNTNSSNSHIFCARVLSTVVGCDTQALSGVYMIDCDSPTILNDNSQSEGRTQHGQSAKKLRQPVAIMIEEFFGHENIAFWLSWKYFCSHFRKVQLATVKTYWLSSFCKTSSLDGMSAPNLFLFSFFSILFRFHFSTTTLL